MLTTPFTIGLVHSNRFATAPNQPIDCCEKFKIRNFVPGNHKDIFTAIRDWREKGIKFVITDPRFASRLKQQGIDLRPAEIRLGKNQVVKA